MKPAQRHRARKLALQALYQWHFTNMPLADIEVQFHTFHKMDNADHAYFHILLHEVPKYLDNVDATFIPFLDRAITSLNPVELMILRMGTYELCYQTDIPYKVVINESVELTKQFGAEQSHKYVNAIMDKVASKIQGDGIE